MARRVRLAVGSLYGDGRRSETFTRDVLRRRDACRGAALPLDATHEERARIWPKERSTVGGDTFEGEKLIVFRPGEPHGIRAVTPARLILLGGEPMDGRRHIWWNFVSSSKERIEAAKADWREGRFDKVFGDEEDFIPLPG